MSDIESRYRFTSVPARVAPGLLKLTIGKYLLEVHRSDCDANREKVCEFIDSRGLEWTPEIIKQAVKQLWNSLELRKTEQRPLQRTLEDGELQQIMQNVLLHNPDIEDCEYNGELFATVFLTDKRISPKRNEDDIRLALDICRDKFKRLPPPVYQPPQYEESDLQGWQLRLECTDAELQNGTREQVRDILQRRVKRDAWKRQNQ